MMKMNTHAYEQALRGHQSIQPMRNDTLRGNSPFFGGTGMSWAGGAAMVIGLAAYSKLSDASINDNIVKTGLVALAAYTAGAFIQAQ